MDNPFKEEDIRMRCFECGGEIVERTASMVFYRRDKTPVFFKDVPVEECSQCGEKYLSGSVSEKISYCLEAENIETTEHLSVPVVHLAA